MPIVLDQKMEPDRKSILPPSVRPWVMAAVAVLVIVAVLGIAWRGKAILLDLAALSDAIWCF